MHESEQRGKLLLNGKVMPDEALARLLGLDKQILTKTLTTLIEYGVASRCEDTGALMNRRMVRDETLRLIRQQAGKKGGNPLLVKQKSTKTKNEVKQKSTPSSSSSPSGNSHSFSSPKKKSVSEERTRGEPFWLEAEAVRLYRQMLLPESPPAIGTQERIVREVEDLPLWQEILTRWRDNQYRTDGVANMLDAYAKRVEAKKPARRKFANPG